MEHTLNQTYLLKDLLGKFVNLVYVEDDELERMHNFIFCTRPTDEVMTMDQSEIYETLDFLRDLSFENKLTCVNDLLGYFEGQEAVSNSILAEENKLFQLGREDYLTHDFVVQKLQEELDNNAPLNYLENCYREMTVPTLLKRVTNPHTYGDSAQILPNSDDIHFKYYYQAFAPQKRLYPKVISFFKKLKGCFTVVTKKRTRKERIKVKDLYLKIYDCIGKEQPIEDERVKFMLSKIMLIAKFNNPVFKAKRLLINTEKTRSHSSENELDFTIRKNLYRYLSQKRWVVLKSPLGSSWSTTDNPGFSIDMGAVNTGINKFVPDPYWTEMSDNAMIYFPLSDQYCLRLAPDYYGATDSEEAYIDFQLCTHKELEVVNKLSLVSQPEVLISPLHGIKKRTEGQCCEVLY